MKASAARLPGVMLFRPPDFRDARGVFRELYHASRYAAAGLPATFVQDNLSRSVRHTLRGLHLQHPRGQGKLVMALEGEVYDVAVDLRRGSPTFGHWEGFELSGDNGLQVYLPPGFAHGFLVCSESALVAYKCSEPYSPQDELIVRWDDPGLGITWPDASPLLSAKDAGAPTLGEIPHERLPAFAGSP